MSSADKISRELDEAETKAWDALARYKFMMFGYWAAMWVHLNRINTTKRANPFKSAVLHARHVKQNIDQMKEAA